MNELKIGSTLIGKDHPVFVIAEIGINHEGSLETCLEMVKAAAEAGANAIKLQTIDADANYVAGTESHKIFTRAYLDREQTARAFELASRLGMEYFTTAADFKTIDWVDELNPCCHKISSGMATSLPIVEYLAGKAKPMLFSTGMATESEIDELVDLLNKYKNPYGMFQCTSLYPTPFRELNLNSIPFWQKKYNVQVGLSDHSQGSDAAAWSVCLGSTMIEKHFSLDTKRHGFDHHISLDPAGFSEMVRKIRTAEESLGSYGKVLPEALLQNRDKYLRCLISACNLKKGDQLTSENMAIKRPLPDKRGLNPNLYKKMIGRVLKQDLKKDEPITNEILE